MSTEAASRTVDDNLSLTEVAQWEPPMAPLDMPRQQLERTHARNASHGLLPRLAAFFRLA